MTFISGKKFTRKVIAQFLLVVMALLCINPAQAFLNRTYSTLEAAAAFNGDFIDILQQGKLRILVTRDYSQAAYLPRLATGEWLGAYALSEAGAGSDCNPRGHGLVIVQRWADSCSRIRTRVPRRTRPVRNRIWACLKCWDLARYRYHTNRRIRYTTLGRRLTDATWHGSSFRKTTGAFGAKA